MSKTKSKIIILGGKGTAINIAEAIYDADVNYQSNVEFLGFAFDDTNNKNDINGFPILCGTHEVYEKYRNYEDVKFLFSMYHQDKMKERAKLIEQYNIPLNKWANFVHPSSFISKSVQLGYGNVVYAQCAIHSNTVIGNFNIFSAFTSIGHDTIIKNNNFTATHVCIGSSVKIENCNFIGQNVGIRGGISISENNIIGIGSNVVKDISNEGAIYVGNPAKKV
jgi:sugar O-acyltransferase (sialic acid O-acetyltransferase NeuD family)